MTTDDRTPSIAPPQIRVRAYPPGIRWLTAALFALGRASLLYILLLVVLASDPPVTPPLLARLVLLLAVAPGAAAWLLARAARAVATVRDATLVVDRPGLRIEVPLEALEAVVPWAVPLPEPGIALRLRSGRALGYELGTGDPRPLLAGLGAAGAAASTHPSVVHACARSPWTTRRWYHLVGRFPLFALLPTAIFFNTHQHIAYGALFGEYYLLGLRSWLATLAVYWGTMTVYLVLWAALWRGPVELASLVVARVEPSRAERVRRAAEISARILYYAGVPVLVGIRFLP